MAAPCDAAALDSEGSATARVLIVSLGATPGLRAADDELLGSLRRAGAEAELVRAGDPGERRTFALTDLAWARAARRAAAEGIAAHSPDGVVYSSITAALLWPRPGAIRFDALAASNRPGRHGIWQRRVERQRLLAAPLLLPWTAEALLPAPPGHAPSVVLPPPAEASGPPAERDIAAVAYATQGPKKDPARVLEAWDRARRDGETLVIAGIGGDDREGVRFAGLLPPEEFRALLRRARVLVSAPVREDYGLVQAEALADGCLIAAPRSAAFAAAPLLDEIDPSLRDEDLARAIRAALDAPAHWHERAAGLAGRWQRAELDALVRERVLPALLNS